MLANLITKISHIISTLSSKAYSVIVKRIQTMMGSRFEACFCHYLVIWSATRSLGFAASGFAFIKYDQYYLPQRQDYWKDWKEIIYMNYLARCLKIAVFQSILGLFHLLYFFIFDSIHSFIEHLLCITCYTNTGDAKVNKINILPWKSL